MTFEELIKKVQDWGQEKGITDPENVDKQFLKFVEEVFEFKTEIDLYSLSKQGFDLEHVKLEFGDVLVTLCILAKQLDIDPTTCLEMAYEKIKNRKGKTIGGTFIKEEDL